MLQCYELISKCCIDFPQFNAGCSKVCQIASKVTKMAPDINEIGPILVIDES